MTKPKKLYRYTNKTCDFHACGENCASQIIEHKPIGTLWRCRHGSHHDFYGYEMRKSAKTEEIENTRLRIVEEQNWLKKLTT